MLSFALIKTFSEQFLYNNRLKENPPVFEILAISLRPGQADSVSKFLLVGPTSAENFFGPGRVGLSRPSPEISNSAIHC